MLLKVVYYCTLRISYFCVFNFKMCTDSLCNPIELRKQGLKTKRKTSGRLADVPPLSTSNTTDNWPAENDRAVLVSLCAEVPLLDHTLMRLGVLGITPNLPLRSQDVLDIINRVVGCTSYLVSAFQLKVNNIQPLSSHLSSKQGAESSYVGLRR